MKIKEIYSEIIHNKEQTKLYKIEKFLEKKIKETKSNQELEELYFLLLVSKIKNSFVENLKIKSILIKYINLVKKIEVSKKSKKSLYKKILWKKDYWTIFFYNSMISRLHYLDNLYSKVFLSSYNKEIRTLKYDYKKDLHFESKNYWAYLSYFFYKWVTWYGNWILQLALISFSILFWFATIFYTYDFFNPWVLVTWFPWMEWVNQAGFEYYFYLSTNIFSNLWADWNLAITPFLRILFDIEQVVWVLAFWLFVFIMWKKL